MGRMKKSANQKETTVTLRYYDGTYKTITMDDYHTMIAGIKIWNDMFDRHLNLHVQTMQTLAKAIANTIPVT